MNKQKETSMKNIFIIIIVFISLNLYSQENLKSVTFFGKNLEAPIECVSVQQGMIKCTSFALFWFPVPSEDLKRHMQETKSQMVALNAKKFECTLLDQKLDAYKYKIDIGYIISICDKIQEQPSIITVWVKDDVEKSSDFPIFLQQVIKVN